MSSESPIHFSDEDDDDELQDWQKLLNESDEDDEEEEVVPMKVESNHTVARLPPERCASGSLTSQITFMETEHGRMRRRQRGIDKKDLQSARKYGKKAKHRFKGSSTLFTRYFYKDIHYIVDDDGKEVTSYANPLELSEVPISDSMRQANAEARNNKTSRPTSNTVLVVDTSGSMRQADVWGARNRLYAVWVAIALDFLAQRLEAGEAKSTDLISIVLMSDEPKILVQDAPCDWLLYNQIIRVYRSNTVKPAGHGNFCPSLALAESLLSRPFTQSSSCPVSLVFLTDGRPSDGPGMEGHIEDKVQNLAEMFGRRLSFSAVGMGDAVQFSLLERLVHICKDFGCQAELQKPALASASIGTAFSSAASSLMVSKLEMKHRQVRPIRKESQAKASRECEFVNEVEFSIHSVEFVRRLIYREVLDAKGKRRKEFSEAPFLSRDTNYVAVSKKPFGEGAERFVYRFFELGIDRKTVVGGQLVAKETRHILSDDNESDYERQGKFVRSFCAAQQISRGLAQKFNGVLDRAPNVHGTTPRVSFLDCSVYEIESETEGTTRTVLVEPKINHNEWYKWNANNGYVAGRDVTNAPRVRCAPLAPIAEEMEEDQAVTVESVRYNAAKVAQSFSHFTYIITGKKRLVCDLQGVATIRILRLSDPVIHYHDPAHSERRHVHGPTDRGRRGIDLFFASHECNELCRLVTKGFRNLETCTSARNKRRGSETSRLKDNSLVKRPWPERRELDQS